MYAILAEEEDSCAQRRRSVGFHVLDQRGSVGGAIGLEQRTGVCAVGGDEEQRTSGGGEKTGRRRDTRGWRKILDDIGVYTKPVGAPQLGLCAVVGREEEDVDRKSVV